MRPGRTLGTADPVSRTAGRHPARAVPCPVHESLVRVIRRSLAYARANREEVLETMQCYAQELSPEVIWSHVELYVNEMTEDLGEVGATAHTPPPGSGGDGSYRWPHATAGNPGIVSSSSR